MSYGILFKQNKDIFYTLLHVRISGTLKNNSNYSDNLEFFFMEHQRFDIAKTHENSTQVEWFIK